MQIQYYQAEATSSPVASNASLNDFQRRAWVLYNGCVEQEGGKQPRPFIFRVDMGFDDSVFTLRSREAFPGAELQTLEVQTGSNIRVRYAYIPVVRNKSKQYTPPKERWPDYAARLLNRAGLDVEPRPEAQLVGYFPLLRGKKMSLPLVNTTCLARVRQPREFARAMVEGIGRKRGFGAGLLLVTPTD